VTQEEIRKLLGGYAANTLTEGERTALFEAALEDQDLFNALHNEDELRELLADPVSREQIRQALELVAAGRRWGFWMRRSWIQPWLIGAASLAAAAVIAIAIVTWHREPAREAMALRTAPAPQSQITQSQSAAKPEAPQSAPVMPVPAQPPAPPRIRAARAARQELRSAQRAGSPTAGLALPEPIAKQEPTTDIANAPLYQGPLVRYSVLRSGPSGDAIRIEVVSQRAGSLALYRADAVGQWQRVFPANGAAVPIAANTTYQIPDDPITIRGNQGKLRLVITPAAGPGIRAQLATGALAAPRADALQKKTEAPAPLVVEIMLGPN
jgi:Domain of unknown function (DUF4384)